MLAISIGLILTMLVARSSVNAKINEIKSSTGTAITIMPAGMRGGLGGGDSLTTDQINKVASTAHVASVASTLTDQLGIDDTNLKSSIKLGNLGKRQMRFESGDSGPMIHSMPGEITEKLSRAPVTGADIPTVTVASDKLTSGTMIDGKDSENIAIVGKKLADKNNLSVGSTFTAYGQTIVVRGIYSTGTMFGDSSIIMPLKTLQTATNQPGAVDHITATADSADNVASLTETLKSQLGGKADIVSQQEQIENSLKPLENIASLALAGVIGAAIAGAIIILLTMVMIVRERRCEIGVIKAIGGTNFKVISQFIVEALTLTIISGVIGLGIGIATSGPMTQSLVQNESPTNSLHGPGFRQIVAGGIGSSLQLNKSLHDVTSILTPQAFATSAGIILLIAVVGSALPVWAIARVRPAEVLRTE
jgi:putative ABC transport system permease protein